MTQRKKWRNARAALAISIVLAVAVLAAALVGPWRGQSPTPTTPSAAVAGSAAGGHQPAIFAADTRELEGLPLPTAAPQSAGPAGCTRLPLNKSNGAWVPDWRTTRGSRS